MKKSISVMKRLFAIVIALMIVMFLVSCAQNVEQNEAESSETSGTDSWLDTTDDENVEGTDDADGAGSADTLSIEATYDSISYADLSESQVLDIYLPEGDGTFPVVVLVHGGAFLYETQKMVTLEPVITNCLEHGYAVVSVDYRKSTEAVFPGALSDVKAAVRFIRANAETYHLDSDRIAIWGDSAGGYLAVMTAMTANVEALNGDVTLYEDQSSEVSALVSLYSVIEFYTLDEEFASLGVPDTDSSSADTPMGLYVGQALDEDKEYTYTTYWETYKDQFTNTSLSVWIQVGDSDTMVPYTQSVNFAERVGALLGESQVSFGIIEGADHIDPLFYTDDNISNIIDFLDETLA